ncbi:Histidine--tRNA ligase [Morus notabilis]|uniref:histidine--tRNA ligase n=1 Tax=Morus notabilis TaxID=981085 RepID=W9T1Y9_9ROSA|nr:histidine--tRNA ligase, chloroplastic/mitochondrial [Morus notabilis]EXC42304.1 Histidine--tRNA ligase [Morus notabilis]
MAAASKSLSFLKPLFVSLARPSSSSSSSLALSRARTIAIPNPLFSANSRSLSSVAFAQSTTENGGGGGGSRAIAPPQTPVVEELQRIDVNPPKGTRDFPPEEMRLRNWLFQNFREVSRLFGFEEVDFPVLESEALYIRKAGEEIREQLYCFEDRGNRRVALRPELTPSLARLVLQKGKSLSLPVKWYAVGQCWRYERMTRGRRREHYQWNMDIIGVPEVTAEAELISSIVTFFKRIGITASDVGFKVSSRKLLQEVLSHYSIHEDLFAKVCIIIDKIGKLPLDDIKKELKAVGVSTEAVEQILQVLSIKSLTTLEEIIGGAGEAIAELKQLFSLAEKFGYSEWVQFDASVVRGLAYYTGVVFEGFDRQGKLRAICGGGRYDQLLSTFGGDDVPACGFGFGDAVIVELLKDKGLLPELNLEVKNIVCALDPNLQGAAATVATILRDKGQSVDLVLENKPLKWVFKRAARINAERLILVGSSEWQRGTVGVKILATGEQNEIKLDELE